MSAWTAGGGVPADSVSLLACGSALLAATLILKGESRLVRGVLLLAGLGMILAGTMRMP